MIISKIDWSVTPGTRMDSLKYNYSGNHLIGVIDYGDAEKGFNNCTTTTSTVDYAYDYNGNLQEDNNKGVTAIAYNYLNLPSHVIRVQWIILRIPTMRPASAEQRFD